MIDRDKVIHAVECRCLCWSPVFAGALTAIGLTFILNLFCVMIGLKAFAINAGSETLMFGGLLGYAIAIIAAMFASGWIAGYLGSRYCMRAHLGALYGFLSWSLALVVTFFLAKYAQEYVFFYSQFISGAPLNATQAAASTLATPNGLVISTYVIFTLFFLSAFTACLGGHCGMQHICKED